MQRTIGMAWDRLHRHEIRLGPDLPVAVYTPDGQLEDPEIIFLPGIASDGRSWHRQASLASRHRVAFFDIPFEVPQAPYTFEILALLLRDAVYQLCTRPPVLVGASFGGMLALHYAAEYPDAVRGIALVGTSCDARWFVWPFRHLDAAVRRTPHGLFNPTFARLCAMTAIADGQDFETAALYFAQARELGPSHYADRIRAIGRLRLQDELSSIHTPALVVHGGLDHTVPVHIGHRLAARLPHAELRIIASGTHSMFLRHAGWFNRTLEEWLTTLP